MKTVTLTKIKKKTIRISNKFFDDIKDLKPRQDNYEFKLFPRVEKFFKDMNQLSGKEFALYIKEQKYTSNTFPDNPNCHQKSSDVFYCLTALLVSNYSESELARHFLPSNFRE